MTIDRRSIFETSDLSHLKKIGNIKRYNEIIEERFKKWSTSSTNIHGDFKQTEIDYIEKYAKQKPYYDLNADRNTILHLYGYNIKGLFFQNKMLNTAHAKTLRYNTSVNIAIDLSLKDIIIPPIRKIIKEYTKKEDGSPEIHLDKKVKPFLL